MKSLLGVSLALLTTLATMSTASAALPPAQVYIVAGSDINMVSRESKVPVSVQNNYDRPVRIRVHAISQDPAVNVQEYVSVNIPANSRKDALLPISVISSGDFKIKVWVTTFTDIRLGKSTEIKLKANPDIELVILLGFGVLIAGLLALGSYRMVSRRRQRV
ncbi:MAG: DUF6049 family protein [Rhodoluna sp.]